MKNVAFPFNLKKNNPIVHPCLLLKIHYQAKNIFYLHWVNRGKQKCIFRNLLKRNRKYNRRHLSAVKNKSFFVVGIGSLFLFPLE